MLISWQQLGSGKKISSRHSDRRLWVWERKKPSEGTENEGIETGIDG